MGPIKALSNMYEKPTTMYKVFLMRCLFDLEMIDGSNCHFREKGHPKRECPQPKKKGGKLDHKEKQYTDFDSSIFSETLSR